VLQAEHLDTAPSLEVFAIGSSIEFHQQGPIPVRRFGGWIAVNQSKSSSTKTLHVFETKAVTTPTRYPKEL